MSELAEAVKKHLFDLPEQDRAELAFLLLESLDESGADEGVDEAWKVELERRWTQIERGEVTGIPANEIIARLRGRPGETGSAAS